MSVNLTKVPKKGPFFDFYSRITITSGSFATQPDMVVPFSTQGIVLLNEDGYGSVIEVSFNGTDVHDRLDPTVARGFTYDNRVVSLIWFRLATGASAIVSVRAWGIR